MSWKNLSNGPRELGKPYTGINSEPSCMLYLYLCCYLPPLQQLFLLEIVVYPPNHFQNPRMWTATEVFRWPFPLFNFWPLISKTSHDHSYLKSIIFYTNLPRDWQVNKRSWERGIRGQWFEDSPRSNITSIAFTLLRNYE